MKEKRHPVYRWPPTRQPLSPAWWRVLVVVTVLVSFFALLPPLLYSVFHTGVYALWGLSLVLWGLVWAGADRRCPWWIRSGLIVIVILTLLGSIAFSIPMAAQAWFHQPAPSAPCIVIVPGARIYGDRPSLMLSYRLDRAAELGQLHPDTVFITSGGRADPDSLSEAEVMKAYLVELGIEGDRIYPEDRSINTEQNMDFSAEIITQQGLSGQVVVSTDAFHQLRSCIFAGEAGLSPVYAVSCKTPWSLAPSYWVREFLGIAHHYVFG